MTATLDIKWDTRRKRTLNYRHAISDDAVSIAHLHAKSWQQTYQGIMADDYLKRDVLQDRLDVWRSRLNIINKNQLVLLVSDDTELVGFICLIINNIEKTILLDNLHINSKHKGKGVAKQLMLKALSILDETNDKTLYLEVLVENKRAISFYEKLFAKRIDKGFWQSPCGNQVEEYVYSWACMDKLKKCLLHE
jgi:ribosomal protein S18 acetylase RimI-like enzyme